MLSVLAVLIFGGSITGYVVLNQPKQQSKESIAQQEKQDFIVSELLEMKVSDNKAIEVTNGDLSQMTFDVKDKTIASVDEKGVITGIKAGETEITVSLDGQQKVCKVIVGEKQTTATEEKKTTDSKKTTSTAETKKSNGTTTSSNKTETTKPSTGGSASNGVGNSSTPAPTPTPEPTYSYFGKQAYNWIIGKGGKDIGGLAYLGDPDMNGYDSVSTIDFIARVQNVRTKDTDYIVTLTSSILIDNAFPDVLNNCLENGSAVKNNILTGKKTFTINNRNYTAQSSRFGYVINVSAKAN